MIYETYKRTMAADCKIHSEAESTTWKIGQTAARPQRYPQRHTLDSANRRTMVRITSAVSTQKHLPSILPAVEQVRSLCQNTDGIGTGLEKAWRDRHQRRVYRWNFCSCKKGGDGVGKTKRGKGTKIMGITDASGLPVSVSTSSASPHEVKLVDDALDACFLKDVPEKITGDMAYDSDRLDKRLAEERGVELIAPHKSNRVKPATQDGRALRRSKKRWRVERFFAWLGNFRRLVVRYEYHLPNFLAMVQLGCIVILLRRVLG